MTTRRTSAHWWSALALLVAPAAASLAQQPGIATRFEIVEYDCSTASSADACNAALQKTAETTRDWSRLGSSVPGRTLISLEQVVTPDVPAVQRIGFDDSRLDLELSAGASDNQASVLSVWFEFERGGDITAGSTSMQLRLGEGPQVVGESVSSECDQCGGGALKTMRWLVVLLSADTP